jgi:hypothetical protein
MEASGRFKSSTALSISIAWGLIPLLEYLPLGTISTDIERALLASCFPGWLLARFASGGVHGRFADAAPVFCAVFTALFTYGAISLLFWFLRRRAA